MCRLSEERSKDGGDTQTIGNETLMGQIASFMEGLHLSYREVFERIPYRNLILMQKDKLHIVTGSIVRETQGRDMIERKMKK